jgi:hypothetical protein
MQIEEMCRKIKEKECTSGDLAICKYEVCIRTNTMPKSVFVLIQKKERLDNKEEKDVWRIEDAFPYREEFFEHCKEPLLSKCETKNKSCYGYDTPAVLVDYDRGWRKAKIKKPESASFKITSQTLDALRAEIPNDVIEALEKIKDKEVIGEDRFLSLLEEEIGKSSILEYCKPLILERHKPSILEHAQELKSIAYKITEQSLKNLESEKVPCDIIERLKSIINQDVIGEKQFINILKTKIGEEQTAKYQSTILQHASKSILYNFLKERSFIIHTLDPTFEEWKDLRREFNNEEKKAIWVAPVTEMNNGNLWMSCKWEKIRDDVTIYLQKDVTLWENDKWKHYIIILIATEGVLIFGPDTPKKGIVLLMPTEQPGAFSMRGYRKVIGENTVFISAIVDCIFNNKPITISLDNIIRASKRGLYLKRRLIELGFIEHDKIDTSNTNLPFSDLKEFAEKLQKARFIEDCSNTDSQKVPIPPDYNILPGIFEILQFAEQKKRDTLDYAYDIISLEDRYLDKMIVLQFENYITVSPQHAQNILRIAGQLEENILHEDTKIYSCAIFGEPGSGKSFIAEEMIKVLKKKTGRNISEPITYNLTQFNEQKNLIDAFKKIQEHILKGEISVVIWDEFDTYYDNNKCGWLPSFLMPMQNSKFFDGTKTCDLGKCIFFFVGGIFNNEEEFIKWTKEKHNEKLKGRDFHSRLDSGLTVPKIDVLVHKSFCIFNETNEARTWRALMIRQFLKQYTTVTDISKGVLIYLLHVPLQYGIRSLEKIIKNSELQHASTFEIKHLPPINTLKLHVKDKEGGEEEYIDVDKFLHRFLTTDQYEETLRLEWRAKTKYTMGYFRLTVDPCENADNNTKSILDQLTSLRDQTFTDKKEFLKAINNIKEIKPDPKLTDESKSAILKCAYNIKEELRSAGLSDEVIKWLSNKEEIIDKDIEGIEGKGYFLDLLKRIKRTIKKEKKINITENNIRLILEKTKIA